MKDFRKGSGRRSMIGSGLVALTLAGPAAWGAMAPMADFAGVYRLASGPAGQCAPSLWLRQADAEGHPSVAHVSGYVPAADAASTGGEDPFSRWTWTLGEHQEFGATTQTWIQGFTMLHVRMPAPASARCGWCRTQTRIEQRLDLERSGAVLRWTRTRRDTRVLLPRNASSRVTCVYHRI